MRRLRPVLIGALIVADLAILLGTPFLETVGEVPRSLGYTFTHFGSDPAAAALPLVRLLLGAVLLAAILDQIRVFMRRGDLAPPPAADPGWTDVKVPVAVENPLPASMAVRDRWHDLPAWTWVGPEGARNVQVGETVWQVDRFSITVETGIDFDEAMRRLEVHDAFRQLANGADDFDRRRAVIMALAAGHHWPFLGRSSFVLATTRITAAGVSALDGVYVLRRRVVPNGEPAARELAYLVAPTTAATALVENDPDLVVALADHLDPPTPDPRDGVDLLRRLTAAAGQLPAEPATDHGDGVSLAPPSQEAVFRIQPADSFQSDRANTTDRQYIVSMARINRIYLSTQVPVGIPIGTPFQQVTAESAVSGRHPGPPALRVGELGPVAEKWPVVEGGASEEVRAPVARPFLTGLVQAAEQPRTAEPRTVQSPGSDAPPRTSSPERPGPDDSPGTERPEPERSGTERPGPERSGTERSGPERSGTARAGGAARAAGPSAADRPARTESRPASDSAPESHSPPDTATAS